MCSTYSHHSRFNGEHTNVEGSLSLYSENKIKKSHNLTLVETICISRGNYISAVGKMKLSAQYGNWKEYTCDHIKEMSRIFSDPSLYNFCISTPIMMKLEMREFVIRNYSLTG